MDKKKLYERNGIAEQMRGQEINKAIRKSGVTESNELALLRKEIQHIEATLGIEPSEEFSEYCEKVEVLKNESN